jgi:hypothetical protein
LKIKLNIRGEGRPDGRQGGGRPSSEDLLEMMDTTNDKTISKDEAKGVLSEQFGQIDANNDGFLTDDELEKGNGQKTRDRKPQGRRN